MTVLNYYRNRVKTENTQYPVWIAGTTYKMGDVVVYGTDIYKCLQAHTSQVGWEPPNVPALWEDVGQQPPSLPDVPTGLTALAVGAAQINVNWDAVLTADGYDLQADGTIIHNVSKPYAHMGLAANSNHIYMVRATNSVGASAWSQAVSATTGGSNPGPEKWGRQVFAPYVDVMQWPIFSINDCNTKTGQLYYTLAFITADNSGNPAWGGVTAINDNYYLTEINGIRDKGGDVIVSFGGANGTEMALANTDVQTLQAGYQAVIDRYNLTWIDFDIEGSAVSDQSSVDRRNKAIKGLQDKNPGLIISYCLPVLPSGLTDDGINVLKNAKSNGVRVDVVNVMAMDFGDWAAPNPDGKMADYAIQSATNTYNQCVNAGLVPAIGVTPMIGHNDTASEVFYQQDAQKLLTWAQDSSWMRFIAMWSVNRDNGNGGNLNLSTGIQQTDFEFTGIFKVFSIINKSV
jgi:chitinase